MDCLFRFFVARMIHHFVHGIFKYIDSSFNNKYKNYKAGDGIHNWESQSCTANSNQSAYRRKCIRTVMPCIRHESAGINFLGIVSRVPIHCLFAYNRNNGCNQCQNSRHFQIAVMSMYDIFESIHANSKTGYKKNNCQDNSCYTFQPFMSIRMFFVRFL